MIRGNIPENIIFIYDQNNPLDLKGLLVHPAFVSDANNENTIRSGIDWVTHRNSNKTNDIEVKQDEYKNSFSNIKLLDLEFRGEGGRAYKILIDNKFYVDFREDVLLDTMLNSSITGLGSYARLEGEFCFAKVGSQMKLIRTNSDLYKSLKVSQQKTKIKELKLGYTYLDVDDNKFVYLGKWWMLDYTISNFATGHNRELVSYNISEVNKVHLNVFGRIWKDGDIWIYCQKSHSFYTEGDKLYSEGQVNDLINKEKILNLEKNIITEYDNFYVNYGKVRSLNNSRLWIQFINKNKHDIIIPNWITDHIK